MADELKGAYPQATLELLLQSGAILQDDHFVYISGDHGSGWIDKDAIYPHTERVEGLSRRLAGLFRDRGIEAACGPATGGMIVAEWTAHELGALAVFTEHDTPRPGEMRGRFVLRRGYDHVIAGKRVLVVDDIVNTGHSIRQTIEAVRGASGSVVAAAALINRGNVGASALDVEEFVYLLEYKIPAWPAAACPLCEAGMPINTQYAHGKEFLAAKSSPT
jgi:orotate phosphoribosyltransferase